MGFVAPYGVQQKQTVLGQQAARLVHKDVIILVPHMLEHPDGNNAVIRACQGAVVLQQPAHVQPFAVLTRILGLGPGNRHSGNACAILAGHMPSKPAPAAADVENAHARP